ncbi:hypothetical protein [Mycolicibacterium goodii]|uniref:hypothetical protein n=1 Tax=Mycolicibacterium goodii TaxID=134601 RepID=UPI00256EB6CC|nr:hypothetical protein [Mycolicibacterium goodii]
MTTSGLNAQVLRAGGGRTVLPISRPTEPDRKLVSPGHMRVLQYEINVVASGVLDVVSRIGGWLFDMRMAGWDVSVALPEAPDEPDDHRALRVLGLKAAELTELWPACASGPAARGSAERVTLTAIATDRFEDDPAVRRRLAHGGMCDGEIAFWGSECPRLMGGQLRRTDYRPSAAARAFKAHALVAAGACDIVSVGDAETVYRGEATVRVLGSALVSS